jgi:hypothetical protein
VKPEGQMPMVAEKKSGKEIKGRQFNEIIKITMTQTHIN